MQPKSGFLHASAAEPSGLTLGVDVGGTKVLGVALDSSGAVVCQAAGRDAAVASRARKRTEVPPIGAFEPVGR